MRLMIPITPARTNGLISGALLDLEGCMELRSIVYAYYRRHKDDYLTQMLDFKAIIAGEVSTECF